MSFTIGCDPEFAVRRNGSSVRASSVFNNIHDYHCSSIGCDGYDATGELRPGFSESPLDLVCKIGIIFNWTKQQYPRIQLLAGHHKDGKPIGGHIHLSVPADKRVIKNLDTSLMALSDLIDPLEERELRIKDGYGVREQFRRQDYSNGKHGIEYRTPGSWLLSPAIALANLTLAKLSALNSHIDFNFYMWRIGNKTRFLKNLSKIPDIEVPSDCVEGLSEISSLLKYKNKIDWDANLLPNWE